MKTVIFHTENAAFKFDQKEVKERLICKHSEYAPGEVISTSFDNHRIKTYRNLHFGRLKILQFSSTFVLSAVSLLNSSI